MPHVCRIYALWFRTEQDCGNLTCAEATETRSAQDVTDQSKALFLMKNIGRSEASWDLKGSADTRPG